MVQWPIPEKGEIEFLRHQRMPDVSGKFGVAGYRRKVACPTALVSGFVGVVHTQGKGGIVIEEK